MTLHRLISALAATGLAAALMAPAAAEQVFQNVSTGQVHPLPTPTGISVYDAYFYPCTQYWNGRDGGRHGSNSGTGTINGERFYPYDPRSTGGPYTHGQGNQWNCYGNQGGMNPHPRPRPTHLPLPNPPRRIPQAAPTPRS